MAISSITLRLDEKLINDFEQVVSGMGLNMTAAFTAFAKATVMQDQLPLTMAYDPLGNDEFRAFLNRKLDEGEERAAGPDAKTYTEDEFWRKHGL